MFCEYCMSDCEDFLNGVSDTISFCNMCAKDRALIKEVRDRCLFPAICCDEYIDPNSELELAKKEISELKHEMYKFSVVDFISENVPIKDLQNALIMARSKRG